MSAWEAPGATDEWYTPAYIFDALGETFDLDVAAPSSGPPYVPCDGYLCDRGLERAWSGFIWMNPPFGGRNGLQPWLEKFFAHGNGIALTPDRTNAPWFQWAWQRSPLVLLTYDKVKFIRPDETVGRQPGHNTALWAAGDRAVAALRRASRNGLGYLAQPIAEAA